MGNHLIVYFYNRQFLFLFISIFFPTIILAQVIIKDEIDLTSESDYVGIYLFTVPDFDGAIEADMWYQNAGATIKHPLQDFSGFEIVAIAPDGQIYTILSCGYSNVCYPCYDNYVHEFIPIYNLHNSQIMGSLSKCINGNPILVPLIIEPIMDDNFLKYKVINSETNAVIGIVWFVPVSCSDVNICQQPLINPDLNLFQLPDPDICNEVTNDIPSGAFKGLYWSLREGEEFTLSTCQDQMTGNVKFIYATNYTQNIDLPYNLELCPDRISYLNLTRIDNLGEFDSYLTEINTEEQACALRQMVIGFKGIDNDGQQTGGEILYQDGIWLTEHTMAHENEHKNDYEKFLAQNLDCFSKFYTSMNCSTYIYDPENAILRASNSYKILLTQFSLDSKDMYENHLNEQDLNGRPSVIGSVDSYLDALDAYIKLRWGGESYNIISNCK